MSRDVLRQRGFWWAVAVLVAAGVVGVGALWFHRELPRGLRSLAVVVGGMLAAVATVGMALVVAVLRQPPRDPRAGATPTGGPRVWFTRLDDAAPAHAVPAGRVITLGAARDADVRLDGRGVALAHARVRIWHDAVDVGRLGRGRVRVDGAALERGAWRRLQDGEVLELGRHRLRVNIGWELDPADPRVGTTIGPHRLLKRVGATPWGTRYVARDAIVEVLERRPLTDDALQAYVAASTAAQGLSPAVAAAVALRAADGTAALAWHRIGQARPVTAEAVFRVCHDLARLHAAGKAHGALTPSHVLPGASLVGGLWFAAALPIAPRDDAGGAPYRVAGRSDDVSDGDEAAFVAPEVRAGAAPSPRADVFALGRWLERSLDDAPHLRAASAWAGLLRDALADDPTVRPADAAALARAILHAAARTAPAGRFADHSFARCPQCGEHLLALGPEQITHFTAVGADGQRFGGRTSHQDARCVGCDHDASRHQQVS